MKKGNKLPVLPFAGSNTIHFIRLLIRNKVSGIIGFLRLLYVLLVQITYSNFLWLLKKRAPEMNNLKNHHIVFIIGHWRSGTTFMHRLLASYDGFSTVSNAAAFSFPSIDNRFSSILKRVVSLHLPHTRPMDWIPMTTEEPQEDEFILMSTSQHATYHGWHFPDKFLYYFQRYCLGSGLEYKEKQTFIADYKNLINEMINTTPKKRLLLKNPCNTGRIDWLAKEFPNAKFIYLHRDAEETIQSSIHLHNTLIERFGFYKTDRNIESDVRTLHKQLMVKYEDDKCSIDKNSILEIAYFDLINTPDEIIKNVADFISIDHKVFINERFKQLIKENKTAPRRLYKQSNSVEIPLAG